MCMCSLAPDADDIAAIKAVNTAGGIPYVGSNNTKLFVVTVEVEQPKKRRKKEDKRKQHQPQQNSKGAGAGGGR